MASGTGALIDAIKQAGGEVELWVCAFTQDSVFKKSRRHQKPTKVVARWTAAQKEVLAGKKDYLSYRDGGPFELIPYKKDGKLAAKPISYRNEHSTVDFFFDEDECVNHYNDQIFKAIKTFEEERDRAVKECERNIERLQESFVKSDYVMEILCRS
jgi:hypothetical protein